MTSILDQNKFGQKMLERMGWKTGKGLGANEDGSTNHIKVSIKNNTLGKESTITVFPSPQLSGPEVLDHSGVIYQRFSLLPIFNVDPHHTGTDATVERNIETRGGKGEFYFETEFGIMIPSHNEQNFILVL